MTETLPNQFIAMLDSATDAQLAELAGVDIAVVASARAAQKPAAPSAPPAKPQPTTKPPTPAAPSAPPAAAAAPAARTIVIEVPDGLNLEELREQCHAIVAAAADRAQGAPKAVKVKNRRQFKRHPVTGRPWDIEYGDIYRGDLAQFLWANTRDAVVPL